MKSVARIHENQPAAKKKVIELEIGGWLGRLLQKHNWGAFTLPFPFFVLILYWSMEDAPDGEVNPLIRVHEFVHVQQDEGNLFFLVTWVKYLYESVRRISWKSIRANGLSKAVLEAYYANGYEAEAYLVEDLAEKNGLPDWAK
jgi:hypothetical protein